MERLFDLDMQLLADSALMIIAILVLFFIVGNKLFNPIRNVMEKRKDKIKTELDTASSEIKQAEELRAQYETKLKDIDKEAEVILSEARKKALANENRIVAEAKEEAARIMERARTEAELEKQKAADEVKKEMVAIASIMAGKVVSASIDTTVQNSLVDETLKEIGDSTWLS